MAKALNHKDRALLVRRAAAETAKVCASRRIKCWDATGEAYTPAAQEIFDGAYDHFEDIAHAEGHARGNPGRAELLDIFTAQQWGEIYYALQSKELAIKSGAMGPEEKRGENKRWIEDLNEIMDRISSEVDV